MHDIETTPKQQGNNPAKWKSAAVILAGLLLLTGWLVLTGRFGTRSGMEAKDDSHTAQPPISTQPAALGALIAQTSDADWRVRAAAYDALSRVRPIEPLPMRDTPIDDREATVLAWLDEVASELSHDLCEVYAQPDTLRFGRTLIARCLVCHVGPEPAPWASDERCAQCHTEIHQQWTGTAHANSTTHLRLVTIDPLTRQQRPHEFSGRRGLSCVACHEPGEATSPSPQPADPAAGCIAPFRANDCATCHTQAQVEWERWRTMPRYRRAVWPPGATEQVQGQPQGCADCHMPEGEHLWAARRDTALLRSGIDMSITKDTQGQVVLSLRNLSGHAYPTGTTRRAIEVYIQPDQEPEYLLTTLAHASLSTQDHPDTEPALNPGEERRIQLPGQTGEVLARLVYVRNRFQPDGYTVEIDRTNRVFTW